MRYLILFLLVLTVLVSGCATGAARKSQEARLIAHLQSWEQFRLDGLVEMNVSQLRFRKNITIRKTPQYLSLNVFDSGIFGLKPTPLISARVDSTFTLEAGGLFAGDSDKLLPDDFSIETINNGLAKLKEQKKTILSTQKAVFTDTEVFFNKRMLVSRVEAKGEKRKLIINFDYDRSDNLEQIDFFVDKEKVLGIKVDRMTNNG